MPPVAKKAVPAKVKPVENVDLPEDVTLPDDDQDTDTDKNEPEIDDEPRDSDTDETGAEGTDSGDELVWVEEPCAVCLPEGWPAQEEGAFVNCSHEHPIIFGQRVQITKERAHELGFGPVKP